MPDGPANIACPNCGATHSADAFECQACGARLPLTIEAQPLRTTKSNAAQFRLSTLLSIITLICVFLALLASAPGLAIFAAIFSWPAFIRTMWVARRRAEIGRPMSRGTKLLAFFGSMLTAITIAVVVVVASFGTFCAICITAAEGNVMGDEAAIVVAGLIALTVTVLVVTAMFKWVRKRYRRDTLTDERPPGGPNE